MLDTIFLPLRLHSVLSIDKMQKYHTIYLLENRKRYTGIQNNTTLLLSYPSPSIM